HVLAYLRSHPETVVASAASPLTHSAQLLHESLEAYRHGQMQMAQELAVAAYLDGFELVEASLDTVNKGLRLSIEAEMLRYRAMLKGQQPIAAIEAQAARIQGLLSRAQQILTGTHLPAPAAF